MKNRIRFASISILTAVSILFSLRAIGKPTQEDNTNPPNKSEVVKKDGKANALQWFNKLRVSGYAQLRYNGLFQTSPNLRVDQADKNIYGDPTFSFRRARLKVSGFVHERVYVYFQADFASNPVVLKDAYADLYLDQKKTSRIRFGLSKVPFGFENMQSSSQRLALDRTDGINSTLTGERDMGVTYFWTPTIVTERFREIKRKGLKHSGDYGMFALGVINGQHTSNRDANSYKHIVTRLTYPFALPGGQLLEVGIQGITGKYTSTKMTEGLKVGDDPEAPSATDYAFNDHRVGASLYLYPQPFGFQAEYNRGKGPEYDPKTGTVQEKALDGGYVQAMYRAATRHGIFFPFVRWQRYEGGKKFEQDARAHRVNDLETGVEWQIYPAIELTAMYAFMNRSYADSKTVTDFAGSMMRFQLQFNF